MERPENTRIKREVVLIGNTAFEHHIQRCIPNQNLNVLTVWAMGDSIELCYQRTVPQKGVSMAAVHRFNEEAGWLEASGKEICKKESERTSLSRTRRVIRELALSNDWEYFVTITLSSQMWNRFSPEGLQRTFSERAKAWRKLTVNGEHPYQEYGYLMIPEYHATERTIHLHGLVQHFPKELLLEYKLPSATPLPWYIIHELQSGRQVFSCVEWNQCCGWNTLLPIRNLGKAGNYISKYIGKELEDSPAGAGKRYWCSRGLKRAQVCGRFWIPKGEENVDSCLAFLRMLATVTEQGTVLYTEHTLPGENAPVIVTAKAIVNQKDKSVSSVLSLLDTKYQRFEPAV